MKLAGSLIALLVILGVNASGTADPPVSQQAMLGRELGRVISTDSTSGMILWIPPETWEIDAFKHLSGGESAAIQKLKNYQVVGVAICNTPRSARPNETDIGQILARRAEQWKSKDEIGKSLRVLDTADKELTPLDPSWELGEESIALLDEFRSGLGFLGQLQSNFHFYVFKSESGEHLPSATQKGNMKIRVDGQTYEWKLPLGSLLDAKECPTCHEALSGAFSFCPWDGAELPK